MTWFCPPVDVWALLGDTFLSSIGTQPVLSSRRNAWPSSQYVIVPLAVRILLACAVQPGCGHLVSTMAGKGITSFRVPASSLQVYHVLAKYQSDGLEFVRITKRFRPAKSFLSSNLYFGRHFLAINLSSLA